MASRTSLPRIVLLIALLCVTSEPAPARQPPPGEPKKSRRDLEKAAARGDAEAQFQLGVLEQHAKDSFEGRRKARPWFRKAARQGHARAQCELGRAYFAAIFSPDGKTIVAGGRGGGVYCLNAATGAEVREQQRADVLRSMEPFPCIDANWYDPAKRCYRFDGLAHDWLLCYLGRYELPSVPVWQSYRNATHDWSENWLDAGAPLWAARLWIMELRRRDHLGGYDPALAGPEGLRMSLTN